MTETIRQQTRPCGDLTEWQLPGRMQELAFRLNGDLMEATRSKIQAADQNRKAECARAKDHFSKRESQYRQNIEQTEKVLKKAKEEFDSFENIQAELLKSVFSPVTNIRAALHKLSNEAEHHIQNQGMSLPATTPMASCADKQQAQTAKDCLEEARGQLEDAKKYHCALLRLVKPKQRFQPDSKWLCFFGVMGSFYVARMLGMKAHSNFLILVFFVLFYAVFLAILKGRFRSKLNTFFCELNFVCSVAEGGLTKGLEQAKEQYQLAIAAAKTKCSDTEAQCKKDTTYAITNILSPAKDEYNTALQEAETRHSVAMSVIRLAINPIADSLHKDVEEFWTQTRYAGADWQGLTWNEWAPDSSPTFAARFGTLTAKTADLADRLPGINWRFSLPALIPFSENRCLLLKASGMAKDTAAATLQAAAIRALANTPPGKARFTLIDPVGLGHNVADFMHLGDFSPELISGKAWTEPQHIEQQLTKLTEDIETVIQTYLRTQYASIQEYNTDHNDVAEPFRFLVVFDFPVNFTESSARRLVSIVKNGPRCGVFTLILHDTTKALPYGFTLKDLEDAATQVTMKGENLAQNSDKDSFVWKERNVENFSLTLDGSPPADVSLAIIKKSGEMSAQGMKKEVPFEKLVTLTHKDDSWLTSSTSRNLQVPLGPAGKGKAQELVLGSGQEAHALLVGRTGSGKTNLMHVIITNLALTYSPRELQLYLIDFKGGVGFKRYAEYQLPHAKVIAIESEREFGLSVLQGLDAELKKRSELFRAVGVDNLAAYRAKAQVREPLPRILLVVDEFQEFFTENDDASQQAKILFDRLARQGRSFGLHFLLATQSLSGSAQLPASIMGQIKVRIALPCSEADSRLILADDNAAARSLSQAGEAIYNSMGGLVEGNNKFQVALFNEDLDLPKYLTMVSDMARHQKIEGNPIIFEGNELAHVEDCVPLQGLFSALDWPQSAKGVDLFLGEPIALLPPVVARLRRQSGSNLIILTRDENEGVGMCVSVLLSILAQQTAGSYRIHIADFTTVDCEWAEHAEEIARCFPGDIAVIGKQAETGALFAAIAEEVRSRGEDLAGQGSIFLVLQGMHRIKSLRENMDDDRGCNSVELLQTILRDGPEVGVHVVAWADTFVNATRGLSRRSMGEFGMRAGAVMSTEESSSVFDDLAASKISKPHRAIFMDEDRPGQLISFRPYAMPPATWMEETGQRLHARHKTETTVH